jgi:hypothetical protein
VLRVIGRLREELRGEMPTVREIAVRANIRSSNPAVYTGPLIKKGYLMAGTPRVKRTLRLTEQAVFWLKKYRLTNPVDPKVPDRQSELPMAMP